MSYFHYQMDDKYHVIKINVLQKGISQHCVNGRFETNINGSGKRVISAYNCIFHTSLFLSFYTIGQQKAASNSYIFFPIKLFNIVITCILPTCSCSNCY